MVMNVYIKITKLTCILLMIVSLVGCANNNQQKETFSTCEDLKGKTIAVWDGSLYEMAIKDKIEDPNISYMSVVSDMINAMYEGKIDAVANSKSNYYVLKKEFPNIKCIGMDYPVDIGAIFGRNDSGRKMKKQYNEFLKSIDESGFKQQLIDDWIYADPHGYDGLNEWDCSNGVLKVQSGYSSPPFTYVYNNELSGYEVALVAEFAKKYHYELDITNNDFAALLASVNTGMCDMAVSGIEITKERAEEVDFSDVEFEDEAALFCIDYDAIIPEYNSLDELNGLKAAVVDGTMCGDVIEERLPNCELLYFNTHTDAYSAVSKGKADFILEDLSKAVLLNDSIDNLTYINESICHEDIAFFTGKNSERQQKILNELNEFLTNNKELVDELTEKWVNDLNAESVKPNGEYNDTLIFGCLGSSDPYDFVRNNEIVGLDIDLMVSFGNEYGYNIKVMTLETAGRIAAASTGKIDVGGSGTTVTEERKETLNFAIPHYHDELVPVVRAKQNKTNFFDSLLQSFEKNFIREDRYKLLLNGIYSTLKISALSVLFGTIIGFIYYLITRKGNVKLAKVFDYLSSITDGLPTVVILMILYYVIFSSSSLSGEIISVVGFTFTFSLSVYGMIRTAVKSVDFGQCEAAYSLGFSDNRTFFNIVLPQALTQFIPNYKSAIVNLVKGTAVVGYIAVQDLTKASDMIRSRTYEAFFPLVMTALIYLLLGKILTIIINGIEFKVQPEKRSKEKILKKYR